MSNWKKGRKRQEVVVVVEATVVFWCCPAVVAVVLSDLCCSEFVCRLAVLRDGSVAVTCSAVVVVMRS